MAFGAVGTVGVGTAEAAPALCPGRVVKTLPFAGGQVRVYRSHPFVCAVTLAKNPGKQRRMTVSLQARGSRPTRDSGYYVHHAGPVRVAAGHRCVRVSGSVGGSSAHSGWIC